MELTDSFPGCMGRMMSLFDLSAGMAKTKLLTERPHSDVVRNCSDVVKKPIYPEVAETEDKQMVSEQRSSSPIKKSGRTPIKMLISQEMWDDTESTQKPPSVVARLMGLDSLPVQQSVKTNIKNSDNSLTGELRHYRQQEGDYLDESSACEGQFFTHENKDYRDVYEVQQQPSENVRVKDQSPPKVRYEEKSYQMRMALVRQKFTEAKRLATDEKLLDSKEFQDAVEVLNSNRDLFIKFLEEPNSFFTNHLFELQCVPLRPAKTCITVLKPSSTMETKGDKIVRRQPFINSAERVDKADKHYWSSGFSKPRIQSISQATRIVVLKPSPGKPDTIKTTLSNNLPMLLGRRVSNGTLTTDELVGSREVAKEITRQMQESLSSNKDEALLSSVLLNGYIGDESSLNRSGSECMEDDDGSTSDSEIATTATEYSWAYANRIGSPFSASSLTRASHSPESSVIKEAKKRLSERWALVASNENGQEQIQLRRTSSTLGEMLAIPELKKEEGTKEELIHSDGKSCNGGPVLSSFLSTFATKDEHTGENSHRNLSRSNSTPLSSSACEVDELNVGISRSLIGKPVLQMEVPKSNSRKSSFKDKISSFFFSRGKKPSEEKPSRFPSVCDDRVQSGSSGNNGTISYDLSQSINNTLTAQTSLFSLDKICDGATEKAWPTEGALSLEKPGISGNIMQKQDRSSPISVSEAKSVDDVDYGLSLSSRSIIAGRPQALFRSPPIESVARSLSRGASYLDIRSTKPLRSSMIISKVDEEHEQFVFVHKLLSSAQMKNNKSMKFSGWHSLDTPLNPSLLYESWHTDDEEGKHGKRQTSRRLLFDAVNAALVDISQSALFAAYPWTEPCCGPQKDDMVGNSAADEVWAIIRNRLSGEKCVPNESTTTTTSSSSSSRRMVDGLVMKEVGGRQWTESRWSELCEFSKEMGGKVLDELIEEALAVLFDQ
ncbi:hypothetical protein C4D60_Mb06t37350 [Musa balbisiana]|uniref:DUF3741 domain-containing protein n=1 Tax=Musa balbisiana TaxID=52838 RepID=A0A4S8ITK7_MUSBA|nr:hypothetical protein C4D60_Mb06t37350 [Musa balbisiana]